MSTSQYILKFNAYSICDTFTTKSGQTTSGATHSDGDTQRGRLVDFFTLSGNNPYGNTLRWTGTTGTSTIQADGIMFDWGCWDKENNLVYTWYTTPQSGVNYVTDIANAYAASFGGVNNWFLPNRNEAITIMNEETPIATNWAPLNVTAIVLRTCTEDPNDNTKNTVMTPSTHNITQENKLFGNPRKWLPFRISNLSEFGL